MYLPPHNAENRLAEHHRIVGEHPLGLVVTYGSRGFEAEHLLFDLRPDDGPRGSLRACVTAEHPLVATARLGTDVLVIFRGVQGYISPNWYPSKHESHRQVPTWNYEVLHAHGRLRISEFQSPVLAATGSSEPMVGIVVDVTRFEGKRKLDQDLEARDIEGAARGLQGCGNAALAAAMMKVLQEPGGDADSD